MKTNVLKEKTIVSPNGINLSFVVAEHNGKISCYCKLIKNDYKHIGNRIFGFSDEIGFNKHIDKWVERICNQVGIFEVPKWNLKLKKE